MKNKRHLVQDRFDKKAEELTKASIAYAEKKERYIKWELARNWHSHVCYLCGEHWEHNDLNCQSSHEVPCPSCEKYAKRD